LIGKNIQKAATEIAIIGGTFDPIHNGHLQVISEVAKKFEKVIVIPTGNPWLKDHTPIASGEQRVAMTQIAVNSLNLGEQVQVSAIEVKRSGPSYAIDTVNELRKIYPDCQFTLVLGSDAASNLSKWHRSDELQKLVEVLVVKRPGVESSNFAEIEISAPDLSSTQIRDKVANSQEFSEFVTPTVASFIKEHHLYGSR
jgi:nicotinate-nucleotide adenylyltransferase